MLWSSGKELQKRLKGSDSHGKGNPGKHRNQEMKECFKEERIIN